ncbi:MAG: type I glutamate--ammonia ligase [Alphaproteobacteria bacterium]|nr:type I glutamate--ammonia ligase [Alphaproteobacteria bacterium]
MNNFNAILSILEEKESRYIDLRFTDLRGRMRHITLDTNDVKNMKEGLFAYGQTLDTSFIPGWEKEKINSMTLVPDLNTAHVDPFFAQETLAFFCDIADLRTGEPSHNDPRATAKKAETHLKSTGIGKALHIKPEIDFFIFDDVRFTTDPCLTGFNVKSPGLSVNTDNLYNNRNYDYRPEKKTTSFMAPPIDPCQDIRGEMLTAMRQMNVTAKKHSHGTTPAQHALGMEFNTLTKVADSMQICRYVINQVAYTYGKTATFMPKPLYGENGAGMKCALYISKDSERIFSGDNEQGLSPKGLYFIGGLLAHARSLNAFTNPSTNSYKRLVPHQEGPNLLGYSSCNRAAACQIPCTTSPDKKCIKVCFPDSMANPYLAYAALLMAGLDGIEKKIDPGHPILSSSSPDQLIRMPTTCRSLHEAIEMLESDRDYLKVGGVFNDEQIDNYIALKREEIKRYDTMPHPVEFDMYYSG